MNGFTSFYWHDYETFGIDPCRDRPAQFAGQRTNRDLEPIGDPLAIYCKPARDVLPNPISCLITGITPQRAERDGVVEAEFAARIHEELAEPGTCAVGQLNPLRRRVHAQPALPQLHDPYAREWENGNSRWDVIDLARMLRLASARHRMAARGRHAKLPPRRPDRGKQHRAPAGA
jgi:exodeoxyribonuclease-1